MKKDNSTACALRKLFFFAMVYAIVSTVLFANTQSADQSSILVISMDYDGCLSYNVCDKEGTIDMNFYDVVTKETSGGFNLHNHKTTKTNWQKVIRDKQDNLYTYIVSLCKEKKYKQVIIACGSLRQNLKIDFLNMYKKIYNNNELYQYTGSCMQGLGIFKEKVVATLKEKYGENAPSVTLDTFLMHDALNHQKDGTTFQEILNCLEEEDSAEFYKQKQGLLQENFYTDSSKISLHYTFMHRIASQHPDAKIDYCVFDDAYYCCSDRNEHEALRQYVMRSRRPKLLNACNWTFSTYPALVPFNVRFVSVPVYKGIFAEEAYITTIRGQSVEERSKENPALTEAQKEIIKQSSKLGIDKNFRSTAYKMIFLAAGSKQAMKKNKGGYCLDLFREPKDIYILPLKLNGGFAFFFIACSFMFYCVSKLFVQLGILSTSTRIALHRHWKDKWQC